MRERLELEPGMQDRWENRWEKVLTTGVKTGFLLPRCL
jgi:hypothetical protein